MHHKFLSFIFGLLLTVVFTMQSRGQAGLCPNNLDFEAGDFTGWECRAGTTSDNPLPLTGPIPGRHTMITSSTGGLDYFGGFPELCPNGSGYSVKLGNQTNGRGKESMSYTYTIPASATNFSMLFYYAIVLESPGHSFSEQPRFQARIIDVATGTAIPCVDFDFIPGSSTGGFRVSPFPGNGGSQVLFKDWTPISINLDAYTGRTIMLEFITSDCTLGGHAGYAYIDVYTACNGAILGNTICPGDDTVNLTAPFGYQSYEWYSDNTFSNLLATTQTLQLTPPPPVGTVFPVIVGPYPGFGCYDTLYATITASPAPTSIAGPDKVICSGNLVQIGGPPTPGYNYSWTPAALVSSPIISNPFAGPVSAPTEFIVETTDLLTGCSSQDTVIVSDFIVDTAILIAGPTEFCEADPLPTLTLNSSSGSIQWYETTGGPIPGATGLSYQPTVSGSYWAELSQGGCPDSTSTVVVTIHPLPLPSFTFVDTACVKSTIITFNNTSNAPDGANMNYLWSFSDGTTQTITDAVKNFLRTGIYTVKLDVTTEFGCKAATPAENINILPNGVPDFTWDSVCKGKPVKFTNLSNENGTALAKYWWDFNNGDPINNLKDPAPVFYNMNPTQLAVTLKMTTLGCESDTQSVTKTIQVNKQADGITYRGSTVPQGSSRWIHVRDTIGNIYNWRPQVQLSSYFNRYTEFFATNDDVTYYIDITDLHTCVTTDTITMLVLKKPGYYLPTAFTPNGDGLNDIVRPYLVGMKGLKSFSIYNRWGNLLFRTTTAGEGWDGKSGNVTQNSGIYIWILEFYDSNNKVVKEKGTITLIR